MQHVLNLSQGDLEEIIIDDEFKEIMDNFNEVVKKQENFWNRSSQREKRERIRYIKEYYDDTF